MQGWRPGPNLGATNRTEERLHAVEAKWWRRLVLIGVAALFLTLGLARSGHLGHDETAPFQFGAGLFALLVLIDTRDAAGRG